jgi:NAD(P)-dependent dehydrogenase (short-subunit alcohol dehydrogenase family)
VSLSDLVDAMLELPVVPSFTKVGYSVRSRLEGWEPLTGYDLAGRTIVVTGATSGIGREAAGQFSRLGARVVVVGRSPDKTQRVAAELIGSTGSSRLGVACADLGELDQVRALADTILAQEERVDVLVHNAGALSAERGVTSAGHESTVASQVLGPFLLTSLLLPALRSSSVGRVITMSSGGMYTAPLVVDELEMSMATYGGSQQYARAKRAQVTLNEMWGSRLPASEVVFHAVHPGWADTPGVEVALPRFRGVMRPLLRSPAQGADTLVWLAADDGVPLATTGGFWHDRRPRPIHRLPRTRRSDTPARREALWQWCSERSSL